MRAYSQFPQPDLHRLDTRPYGLQMKNMKGLKEDLHCLGHETRSLHFFYKLAHGIARVFMSFMVRSVRFYSFIYRQPELLARSS